MTTNATPPARLLLTGIRELLTMPRAPAAGAAPDGAVGLVRDAAVLIEGGRIAWCGPAGAAPAAGARVEDLGGAVVLPGLVDCHTHLVWAGDRTRDFEARLGGATYAEIARAGGGIRLTMRAVRGASAEELAALAAPRLDALLAQGVTTVEVKSGYGLSLEHELKQLEAVALLAARRPARLVPTCLAAHIVPDEHRERRRDYVRLVTDEILPAVAARGLAVAADVFCDEGAFTLDEAREILIAATRLGLQTRVHGEQLTATGVAQLAASLGALSVDHLEHLDADGVAAMAAAGTVAVLLPGATTFLAEPTLPPVKALRAAGVPMAVATDANPGSSPTTHLWLMAQLACVTYGLMPHEALRGVTVVGARALGLDDEGVGQIVAGGPADLVATAAPGWRHLVYGLGDNPARRVWVGGREP